MNFGSLIPWREKSQFPSLRDGFYDPLWAFKREVDRMFDDFFSGNGGRGFPSGPADFAGVSVAMDVTETENEVMITAELPGLDAKDFDITLVGDVLTIKGEKKFERQQDIGNGRFMERRYGSFARSLTLPFAVAEEKIDANYDKGVLTIRIPKPAEMKRTARRIEVKSA